MPFPALFSGQQAESGVDAATSKGIVVDPHNTAHTKGGYAQLVAATAFATTWLQITYSGTGATVGDCLVDVAIGAATSEVIVWPNLLCHRQVSGESQTLLVPFHVPAGTRIAAAAQSSSANETACYIGLRLFGGGPRQDSGLQQFTTYGANTADSGGTSVDPGAGANTKGAYTELSSASTAPIRWLLSAIGNQKNGTMTSCWAQYDIAIGAGTSEVVVSPDGQTFVEAALDQIFGQWMAHPVEIATGVRLAVRAQSSITDATDRLFDIILYGVS